MKNVARFQPRTPIVSALPRGTFAFASRLLLLLAAPRWAIASPVDRPMHADRMETPGSNGAADDGVRGLVLNPATLAFQPDWELRAYGQYGGSTGRPSGVSLDAATPFFGLGAFALRVEQIVPNSVYHADNYFANSFTWATLGFGTTYGRTLAFGASLEGGGASRGALTGLGELTAGGLFRPSRYFSFGLTGYLTNQRYQGITSTISGERIFEDRLRGSLLVRPFGTRGFEIGVDAKYFMGSKSIVPRVTAAVDIPGVGRARGDFEAQQFPLGNRTLMGSLGLEVSLGSVAFGGGAFAGTDVTSDGIGGYGTATYRGFTEPGVAPSKRFVAFRMEKTPGTRSHVRLLRALWRLAEDDSVEGVSLVIKGAAANSFAHAEELADALRVLRAHGKKSFCALENDTGVGLFACASADRIVVNPAGGIRYSGLKSQRTYLKGLLDKVGVKAEFVRIGEHKSAPEQFTNEHGTEPSLADQTDLLAQKEAVFVENLVRYRHLTAEEVRASTLKGPFTAREARDAKFVDSLAYDDELEKVARELVGHPVNYVQYAPESTMPTTFGTDGRVAVLYIDGEIVDGRSRTTPLLNDTSVGSYTLCDQAKALRNDPSVKAVVLRIESPGGSSVASEIMWRELSLLAQRKPLVVSMGGMAASGGYYVAVAGQRIFANPLTLTGSIGIFYGKPDVSGLLSKLGVNVDTVRTAPRADAESIYRGFTDDERAELSRKVAQFYDVFLERVADGRHQTKASIDAVGQGRVWAGQQALTKGLVDELGGLRHALEAAKKSANLPTNAPVFEVASPPKTLLEQGLALAGVRAPSGSIPQLIEPLLHAVAPLAYHPADVPLARTEWVDLDEPISDNDD